MAGFRCPNCYNLLPVWSGLRTMRPKNTIDALRCSDCDNYLVPEAPFGLSMVSFIAIVLPVFFVTSVVFNHATNNVDLLTYVHAARGDGEPNILAMLIVYTFASILSMFLTVIVHVRLSKVKTDNDWRPS